MTSLKIGVVFPQTEIGSDPTAIRDYAQTAEGLGFTHILAYDHVLGANPDRPGGFQGPYTFRTPFHEVFVLFGYLAGVTRQMEMATGILILPQRQTALVAKQAASLDVLSGGRLRMGVGIGWNEVEYTGLNENFHNRGKRIEEQVVLLRKLWANPLVDFHGSFDTIPDAGISPLPTRGNIPIWFGGHADAVIRRAARLGDGWMPNYPTVEAARPTLELLKQLLEQAGRQKDSFGIEPRLSYGKGDLREWERSIRAWQAAGATHLSFNTMGSGFQSPSDHIQAISAFAAALHT